MKNTPSNVAIILSNSFGDRGNDNGRDDREGCVREQDPVPIALLKRQILH